MHGHALRVVLMVLVPLALLAPAPSLALAGSRRCPAHKFDCQNGKCISGSLWCNGYDDCGGNAADETSCPKCLSGSLMCAGETRCISPEARCNGTPECMDGSDESGCPRPETGESTAVPSSATTEPERAASPENSTPKQISAADVSMPCRTLALYAMVWAVRPLAALALR